MFQKGVEAYLMLDAQSVQQLYKHAKMLVTDSAQANSRSEWPFTKLWRQSTMTYLSSCLILNIFIFF
jgi:hypothetical protein